MSVRVIVPPEPILTATEVVGGADPAIDALIAAVTAEIDGPDGWLGRAIGPQTLELSLDCWPGTHHRLSYPPFIEMVGIKYEDEEGAEQSIDPAKYDVSGEILWFQQSWSPPSLGITPNPIRIIYRAGYDGEPVADGGTGPIPPQIKSAVILSVQHLRALSKDDLFLKVDEVDGIGRKEYTVSEQAGLIIRTAADRLLGGLRRYV